MNARLTLERPWLELNLETRHRVLSWAINRPGFVTSEQILWREVRNADLPPELDVEDWLQSELKSRHAQDSVTFLTSRNVTAYHDVTATAGQSSARCVATVGLSNAERVGARVDRTGKDWGTINIAVICDNGLTDAAMIEALSIAAQARTVAVMDAGLHLPTGLATGTGTDCIAIAAPLGHNQYAGLHTDIGEAFGRAVLDAVRKGAVEWMQKVRRKDDP